MFNGLDCAQVLTAKINTVIDAFKDDIHYITNRIASCFYSCLQKTFLRNSLLRYNRYPQHLVEFIAENAFSDSILMFTQKAHAGELYDGNASIKTIISRYYDVKMWEAIQRESRLDEKKRHHGLSQVAGALTWDAHTTLPAEKWYAILEAAMARLTPKDLELVTLRHLDKKTCDEIAAILDITTKSATNAIYRSMERLRGIAEKMIRDYENE